MEYDYDPALPGTRTEQAKAQVGFKAYDDHTKDGFHWHHAHREQKIAWIKAVQAIDKASEPSGPD